MVQLVHQLLSPNRHPQTPGVGEVRQPPSPRLVLLSENDLARRPVLRLPAPNPSLQRPPNPRMTPHHLFVQRHRPQPRVRLQQRHDLLVEYPRQRVGASPPPRLLHRPTPRIPFDPMRRRPAEPRLRRRQRRPVLPSSGHVQLHLVVRNPSARHFASLLIPGKHQSSNLPPPPPAVSPCLSQASHPDCRATRDVEFSHDGSSLVTIRRSKTSVASAVQYVGVAATSALRRICPNEPRPTARVFGLRSGRAISNRLGAMALAAGRGEGYTGHSPRVGMAQDLAAAGVGLAALMVAGRWKSARMPAHYARGETARRGAVARYHGEAGPRGPSMPRL